MLIKLKKYQHSKPARCPFCHLNPSIGRAIGYGYEQILGCQFCQSGVDKYIEEFLK